MKTIGEFDEKNFLKTVVSKYADTATVASFDDCIVLDLNKIMNKTDLPLLVYSIDHPSFIKREVNDQIDHRFYGRYVAAMVCGDVLAMGAQPLGFSMDIAAPLAMEVQKLEWIMQGVQDVLREYGATYEGGNFDGNTLELVGMAWGLVEPNNIIRRAGAKEGDYIAVTTTLGHGWADYISRKLNKTEVLSEETQRSFKSFNEMPIAPCSAILAAAKKGGITSGMDLSDGVIEFLYTIQEKNGFGVTIYEDWIEITSEMQEVADKILKIRPSILALEPGYDAPLGHAYTISPDKWDDIAKAFDEHGSKIYKLGVVQKAQDIVLKAINSKLCSIPPFWDDQLAESNTIERWLDMIKQF